ncbi:transposase [Kribbella sp. NPDC049584]|uniref:transposase n=1 Tax=Kribbella sp. NPDC049584 TaxID=3154833 RepID=UPI0034279DB2
MVATGVNVDGFREILGVATSTAESGAGCNSFFKNLVARGLNGVALVTSDAHAELVDAIGANLPGASWQRCRTHYTANLMSVCPKHAWGGVKAMLHALTTRCSTRPMPRPCTRSTTNCSTRPNTPCPRCTPTSPGPTTKSRVHGVPQDVWRQIWSNNSNERLNREIRRRTDVVGIFPIAARSAAWSARRPGRTTRRMGRRMARRTPLPRPRSTTQSRLTLITTNTEQNNQTTGPLSA